MTSGALHEAKRPASAAGWYGHPRPATGVRAAGMVSRPVAEGPARLIALGVSGG